MSRGKNALFDSNSISKFLIFLARSLIEYDSGHFFLKGATQAVRQQGDENINAGSRRSWKDDNPLRTPTHRSTTRNSLVQKLKLNQQVTTIPTVGFNVETVTYKNVK